MKTKATNDFPEIEWEDLKQELIEEDVDERMKVFITTGVDAKGNLYFGNAYFYADIFEDIKYIEKA